jgi:hypothetical protein
MATTTPNKQLTELGFRPAQKRRQYHITVSTQGHPSTGKTDWALRTAPGPIGFISLDLGTEDIEEKFLALRNDIYIQEHKIDLKAGPEEIREACSLAWASMVQAMNTMCIQKLVRTVVIDTGDKLWKILRMGKFGALKGVRQLEYEEANQWMSHLLYLPQNNGINMIVTHTISEVWDKVESVNEKTGKVSVSRQRTGEFRREGFGDMSYIARLSIENLSRPGPKGRGLDFGVRILKCTADADLVGLELWAGDGDDIGFTDLAQMVYPNSTPEDWK